MLGRVKISTAIYLIAFFLLVGWVFKTYIIDNKLTQAKISDLQNKISEPLMENLPIEEIKEKYRRLADGIFVDDKNLTQNYPTFIIVENLLESRPQAGLDQASLVFEASAEGGITRFLVLFDTLDQAKRIGPIRSVRPYFLDLAEGYNRPIFLHVGGSPEALQSIKKRNVLDLDEFYWRYDYYLRVSDRVRPHDTYTTPELVEKIKKNYKLETSDYKPWQFKEDDSIEERGDISIQKIDFSRYDYDYEKNYTVAWDYDKILNLYIRKQGDKIHEMENGSVITAKNIAVMYVDQKVIDDIGRLKIQVIGENEAEIFQDGKKITGKWKKELASESLKFYNSNDEEVSFNAGQTWVEIVPKENKLSEL
jgi:hypothetical protein